MAGHIEIELVAWCEVADMHLDGVGGFQSEEFKSILNEGDATLYAVKENGIRKGTALMDWLNPKCAVCHAFGSDGSHGIAASTIRSLEMEAKSRGFKRVCFFTNRPGLIRTLARLAHGKNYQVIWEV